MNSVRTAKLLSKMDSSVILSEVLQASAEQARLAMDKMRAELRILEESIVDGNVIEISRHSLDSKIKTLEVI